RVGLGIKQLLPNPLDQLRKRFPPKIVVKVKVVAVEASGARVALGPDVSGWIASSELRSDGAPAVGAEVSAVVLGVRSETFDLNLSMKKLEIIEDKKRIRQYMKGAPPLTLGQLFKEEEK
ncbi:MAG: S1 RNA-binding domain-containing protein, partial [Elusimicrobia bacterium]|nr:S1 RNA-binding domain-containing protein [Elusimicrobiota bacterium]